MGPDKVEGYLRLRAKVTNTNYEDTKAYADMMNGQLSVLTQDQVLAWTAKQAYIGLGTLVAAASELKIDSCPMEGFDKNAFDEILGLKDKGVTSAVLVAVGYRSEEDSTQIYAKTRKPLDEVFETIK
jgi:nitroreductase